MDAYSPPQEHVYRCAVWVQNNALFDEPPPKLHDDGKHHDLLTTEEDSALSDEELMKKAVKNCRRLMIYEENMRRDYCMHCEEKKFATRVDESENHTYCDDCGERKERYIRSYCLDSGKTRNGQIVFEMWEN